MMKRLKKTQKMGITFAVLCCALLAIVFSADHKKLFARVTDALNALTGTEAMTTVDSMVVMNTEDAKQADDYYAFGVYAPNTATYTIGVTAENGKVRVNTGEATAIDGTEVSLSLTEGTNVLYFVDCENPSIQWDSESCELEPINKVCMPLSGDVNQNENRTVEDLVLIKREADTAGTGNIDRAEIADIDGDDSVTNEDARLLRTLMVGNPECEVAERCPLIVDAYIEETGTIYDTLAEAVAAASTISVSDSKEVTVTVLNPTGVKLVRNAEYLENQKKYISIPVTDGAQIELKDDGAKDSGWSRTITRGSTENFKMFAIGANASLTLTGSSELDENSSLILDGGAKANNGNHIVDVGNTFGAETAELTMNAGVKITNNENNGATSSGGALAVKGTFNMKGGVISGNTAKGTGGAINLLSGSVMNMAGGIITENETKTETSSGGGINVSAGATLVMEGGKVYGNISPVSVGNNSVRVSGETSVLKMGGAAYIDRVCIDTASSVTPYIELTSALTTTEPITLFFPQPLNKTGNVVHRDSSCAASDSIFKLSERMLPCTLVQDDSNENLCLKSSTEGMEKIKASLVYSNYGFDDDTWAVQGVCSDGTYLYAAIEQEETVGVTFNGCKILKVNLATWQVVGISETVLPTDHSNEMTYNPNTGKIYITHCMSSGVFEETTGLNKDNGPYAVSVVEPSNLDKVERVIQLSDTTAYTGTTGIYGLAYNNSRGYYVAGCTGFRFGFLADSGEIGNEDYTIKETMMPSTGMVGFTGYTSYTKQGVYANDTTIYTNNWNDKDKMNLITMYDWRGNYNGTKYVVDQSGNDFTQESESLFEYNGDMYMACIPTGHNGVDIYKLDDVGKVASPIDVKDANGVEMDDGYVNLADAITKANELGTATIVLKEDVIISTTQTITGNVTITDDGTKRTVRRSTGCTNEMFNVAGGATLTFTSSTQDDSSPMLVIDGNKANVTTTNYAPVVHMNQTNGILNITSGVIVENNKSHNAGGVIYAGANKSDKTGGGLATINITGGLFTGNEIDNSSQYLFGGCIYIENGCTLNISDATFENTTMATEHEKGQAYGGVISVRTNKAQQYNADGASVTLKNCTFKNTTVTQSNIVNRNGGGVLQIGDGNPKTVQITNCQFANNFTEGLGGAIYVANTTAAFDLSGCSFSNNADVNGTNDIYMAASTDVNVSGDTQANIYCAGQEQIHITETFGTESEIKVTVPDTAMAGTTVATFASEDIMTACKGNRNIVLSETSYALSYDATNLNATLVDAVAVVEDSGYASLAEAIDVASTMTSDADNPVVIKLISDTVAVDSKITIPEGTFVEIIDDGMQRTLQRASGCTAEMFNVAGGAGLTFTSSSKDDKYPLLVIDGNKANVKIPDKEYAPVVKMNKTDGILNITPGVIIQNNKSGNTGGVIYAGANKSDKTGGGLATINITGGLFTGNEVEYSSSYLFGGCIYIEAGCTLNIINATFDNTTMKASGGTAYGGVISVRTNANQQHADVGANVTLENCLFKKTTVTQKNSGNGGGVLYIGAGNNGSVQITNCEFTENSTGGVGGAIDMRNTNTELVLSGCTFNGNTDKTGTNDIYMVASTNVNVSGNTQANINCAGTEQIHITETLETESVINVTMSSAATGATVATFASEEIMNDCIANENLVLTNREYVLSYEETADSEYIATLVDAVAVVGENGYASLADAIAKAVTMESDLANPVVITLISDTVAINSVTTIPTGTFVNITDDGTARTIKRQGFTDQMFVVESDAGLTFTATSEDNATPSLVIDGNKDEVGASNAMVSLGTGSGALTINGAVQFTNANIDQDGGIIRTEDGSTAVVTVNGGVFDNNEASISGDLYGGIIRVSGSADVTISNAVFENNTIASTAGSLRGGIIYVGGGTVNIVGSSFNNNTVTTKTAGNGGVIGTYGGMLHVGKYNDANGDTIEGACSFTGNIFTSTGGANAYGGVFGIGAGTETAKVYNSTVTGNTAEHGGAASVATSHSLTVGDCTFEENAAPKEPSTKDIRAAGTVIFEGKVNATAYSSGEKKLQVNGALDVSSKITVTMSGWVAGRIVVTFDSEAGMSACQTNGNLALTNSAYTLIYETTSESKYFAKLGTTE